MNNIDFAIVGAQKSGSTYLHRLIESHPDVFLPNDEFRWFEDPEYSQWRDEGVFFSKVDAVYGGKQAKLKGIKSADYLCNPSVPGRLHEYNPAMKIIVTLRDPVKRFVSAYYHYVYYGLLPIRSLNQVFDKIISGQYEKEFPVAKELLAYGMYGSGLERYLDNFSREAIWVNDVSRLHEDEMTSEIYEFLGLSGGNTPAVPQIKKNIGVYQLKRLKFLQLRNRFAFHYTHGNTRVRWKNRVARTLWWKTMQCVDIYALSRIFRERDEPLKAEYEDRLKDFYYQDYQLLLKLSDQDIHYF